MENLQFVPLEAVTYAGVGLVAYAGVGASKRAPPSGTAKCLFQRLFAKNPPRATLKQLWNVIVAAMIVTAAFVQI